MFCCDGYSLRAASAVAGLAVPLLTCCSAHAQLQYHTRLQFPVTSVQGDTNLQPSEVWMPTPDTLAFSTSIGSGLYENTNGQTNRIVRSSSCVWS